MGPAQGPPLYAQCLVITAQKKRHHTGDEKTKLSPFCITVSLFLVLLIIVQQVQNKAGADPRPGPVAAQAMKLAARELSAEESADHDWERDKLPAQTGEHAERDHQGYRRVH